MEEKVKAIFELQLNIMSEEIIEKLKKAIENQEEFLELPVEISLDAELDEGWIDFDFGRIRMEFMDLLHLCEEYVSVEGETLTEEQIKAEEERNKEYEEELAKGTGIKEELKKQFEK